MSLLLSRGVLRFLLAIFALGTITGGVFLAIYMHKYAGNEVVSYFMDTTTTVNYLVVYGLCSIIILIGLFELLACYTMKGCYIFLVTSTHNLLVWDICFVDLFGFHRSLYILLGLQVHGDWTQEWSPTRGQWLLWNVWTNTETWKPYFRWFVLW